MENFENKVVDAIDIESGTRITKRYAILSETHKKIKIKAIELGIDDDGKLTPEMLGIALDAIVNENIALNTK